MKKAVNTSRETLQGRKTLGINPSWCSIWCSIPSNTLLEGITLSPSSSSYNLLRNYRKISHQSSSEKASITGLPQEKSPALPFPPPVQHQKGARHPSTGTSHHQCTWVPIPAPGCPHCTSPAWILRAPGNLSFVSISHLPFPTGNPSSRGDAVMGPAWQVN